MNVTAVAALAVAGGVLGLSWFTGTPVDAASVGLALAGAVLVGVLRSLFRWAQALARSEAEIALRRPEFQGAPSELREERHRLLRAIKELDFDRQMGKISASDHAEVRERYLLRVVEVNRGLDERPAWHPDLVAKLAARGEEPPA